PVPLLIMAIIIIFSVLLLIIGYRFDKEDKSTPTVTLRPPTQFKGILVEEFRQSHRYVSLCYRPRGVSFRSVDRVVVFNVYLFMSMAGSAMFYAPQQSWNVNRILAGLILTLVCRPVSSLLALILARIGEPGLRGQDEECCRFF